MFSCERAKSAGDDYAAAEEILLESLREAAERTGWPEELLPPDPRPEAPAGARFGSALSAWCRRCPRRVVLFMDEIDALQGNSLVSILSQLRHGHNARPGGHPFPASVVLCGLRDLRDYEVASGGESGRCNSGSPFNIVAESLRLGDFTADEIAELYGQHTQATGQEFAKDAVDRVFELTQGQPWLVNALAYELIIEMGVTDAITAGQVEDAKERLIRARATHLDSLTARLHEPRVKRVIEPIVAGTAPSMDATIDDDVSYVHDLGLIPDTRRLEIANPIYREVLLRVLGARTERLVTAHPHSFVLPDGRFDLPRLLQEFVVFWREHGEVLIQQEGYHEAACQIILMAFLHRLVNGRHQTPGRPGPLALPRPGRQAADATRGHGVEGLASQRRRPDIRRHGPARPLPGPAHSAHRRSGDLRPAPRGPALEGTRRLRAGDHAIRTPGHRSTGVRPVRLSASPGARSSRSCTATPSEPASAPGLRRPRR
jgi:hypothetical protein